MCNRDHRFKCPNCGEDIVINFQERKKIIAKYILDHPDDTYEDIARAFSVSEQLIRLVGMAFGVNRLTGSKGKATKFLENKA